MAQRIQEQSKSLENFPRPYQNFLNNLIIGLTRVRDEQIEAINQLKKSAHKTTPVSYNADVMESINDRVVQQLETGILFLVRMTNRQKMDQVMDLERQLNELTQSLREEFDKIKNKEAPLRSNEMKAKLEQIRQVLQKIMDQLSRQTQSMPDEFLNAEAFKHLNMDEYSASLDRIMDLLDQGKFDQAQAEMEKAARDLQTLSNQLNQSMDNMENLVDMEMMQMLDDSIEKLEGLERRQRDLLDKTTKINRSLHSAQSKSFSDQVENLFDALKKDVNGIQSIFREDQKLLTEHPIMQKLSKYLDEEAEIRKRIREMGQKTVDSAQGPDLQKNFENLNQERKKLSRVNREIDNLRVRIYRKFKEELFNLLESYNTLEELAEIYDLDEFNSVFKNTYPEVFHWQNNLRTTHNKQETLGDQLDSDLREVSRLNGEISKKLGSMMQMIRESEQSLLTEENKSQLNKLAEQENQLRQEAEKMKERFDKMNQQNPMISPELEAKMARAGRHMKRAPRTAPSPNFRKPGK
jgi:soluble cytochrome b562